jgi:spermidine synthase
MVVLSDRVPMWRWLSLPLMSLMFALSGIAALIYQVAWQRILALHSGVGIYSVALIVSAFMAGLGLGSYWGGRLVTRTRPATALLWFAGLELAIGGWAFISCQLYYHWLGSQATWLYASLGRAGLCHFLALLPPTCLMGMSLPFLAQAAVEDLRLACRTIGVLYGFNILGAAIGAIITPWVLIRYQGIDGAVTWGAAANLIAGLIAWSLWRFRASPMPSPTDLPLPSASRNRSPTTPPTPLRFGLWMGLYGLSGFFALAFEIVWFRLIDVAVRSTAFTFGSVLAMYLLGLGLGCLFGGSWALKVRSPLRAFLLCQTILLVYAGGAAWLMVSLPIDWPVYSELVRYWSSADVFGLGMDWNWPRIGLLYVILPAVLYGPPTVLMGLSFAVLHRAVHDDPATTGRRVGFLQAANIIGNVAGSLLVGVVLLEWFGTPGTIRLLLGLGTIFPILGWRWLATNDRLLPVGGMSLILMTALFPSANDFWARLHGVEPGEGMYGEDASGLMSLTPSRDEGGIVRVSMNGKWQSWLPFGGIHSELGAVAAVLHPDPQDVAIIGLGSGDTAWAASCREETRRIVVYEICAAEQVLLRQFASAVPDLQKFLEDPRVTILAEDGRRSLSITDERFDLIEADALRPTSAYAGNIYSVEFFRLCASRLKPGGLMCQWGPTPGVYRTFCEAFPHVVEVPSRAILIGSNEPIDLDAAHWQATLDRPTVRTYLGELNYRGLKDCLSTARPLKLGDLPDSAVNRDLFPRDEFASP